MRKKDVTKGMKVTCKVREEAYYSGYAGRPVWWFEPGMIGVVGAVDVPGVYSGRSFVCVDFQGPATGRNSVTGEPNTEWRCALYYDNIVKLK